MSRVSLAMNKTNYKNIVSPPVLETLFPHESSVSTFLHVFVEIDLLIL
jgi:hypothetical protein